MADPAEWLLAQYDAAEKAAQAAAADGADGRWRPRLVDDMSSAESEAGIKLLATESQAGHIGRYDPAAVLADLAAKRRIAALHKRYEQGVGMTDDDVTYWPNCQICPDGDVLDLKSGRAWPCETLRLLAWALRDRDGYDPAWAPAD